MKEDTIDDLKEQIRKLELMAKIRDENAKLDGMAIKLLVASGHLSEEKLQQARDLAASI